ncbi:MAG: class I SAM-dependent methyltransferase [Candidatus Omnitrophota bacterium]
MKHTLNNDQQAIQHHYDVSNDFYRLFLGKYMVYSCAYFQHKDDDIDQAQFNKLDYICRKLRLKPGERFLDIGSGWGSLVVHAAKHYGVHAYGVTLSKQQYQWAQDWIRREGLQNMCRVEIKDYRELTGHKNFDKITSIGMFEHVGIDQFRTYFQVAKRLLKEDGLFLNHGITTERTRVQRSTGSRFMDTFIFPNAELINISYILQHMEELEFEIIDVESLRRHYARTLALWCRKLRDRNAEALQLAGERTYRTWLLYMAGCAHRFREANVNIYQVLLSKRGKGSETLPMTRADVYR